MFLEYDFIAVYKPSKTHVVTNALSRLLDSTKLTVVPNQTIKKSKFAYIGPEWLNDAKDFFKIGQIEGTLLVQQKQRSIKRAKPFTLKNGELYRMGQDNILRRCLTIIEAHMVMRKLHGPLGGHFVMEIM